MLLIILCLFIVICVFFLYISTKTYEHFFDEKNQEYTEFYNKLTSDSIDNIDKCKLVKQQIADHNQGIEISKPILNASYTYNSNSCENNIKKSENSKKNDYHRLCNNNNWLNFYLGIPI